MGRRKRAVGGCRLQEEAIQMHSIIIAEQNPVERQHLADILLSDGYRVEVAEDVREAFLKAHHASPDAVILNCGEIGPEAVEAICLMLKAELKTQVILHGMTAQAFHTFCQAREFPAIFLQSSDPTLLQQALRHLFAAKPEARSLDPVAPKSTTR